MRQFVQLRHEQIQLGDGFIRIRKCIEQVLIGSCFLIWCRSVSDNVPVFLGGFCLCFGEPDHFFSLCHIDFCSGLGRRCGNIIIHAAGVHFRGSIRIHAPFMHVGCNNCFSLRHRLTEFLCLLSNFLVCTCSLFCGGLPFACRFDLIEQRTEISGQSCTDSTERFCHGGSEDGTGNRSACRRTCSTCAGSSTADSLHRADQSQTGVEFCRIGGRLKQFESCNAAGNRTERLHDFVLIFQQISKRLHERCHILCGILDHLSEVLLREFLNDSIDSLRECRHGLLAFVGFEEFVHGLSGLADRIGHQLNRRSEFCQNLQFQRFQLSIHVLNAVVCRSQAFDLFLRNNWSTCGRFIPFLTPCFNQRSEFRVALAEYLLSEDITLGCILNGTQCRDSVPENVVIAPEISGNIASGNVQLIESQGNLFGGAAHVLIQLFSGFDDRFNVRVNEPGCILPLLQRCGVDTVHSRIRQQVICPDGCIHAGIPESLCKLCRLPDYLIDRIIDRLNTVGQSGPAQFGSDRGQRAVQTGGHAVYIAQLSLCRVGIGGNPLHGLAQLFVFLTGRIQSLFIVGDRTIDLKHGLLSLCQLFAPLHDFAGVLLITSLGQLFQHGLCRADRFLLLFELFVEDLSTIAHEFLSITGGFKFGLCQFEF